MTAQSGEGEGRKRPQRRADGKGTSRGDALIQFADYVVTRLFSVSLRLEGARSMLGGGPANDRIAAATDETDSMIRDIRAMVLNLAADRGDLTLDPPSPPDTRELLDGVVNSIYQVGLLLQAAPELPRDTAGLRIADALRRLDDVVRDIRDHPSGGQYEEPRLNSDGRSLEDHERLWQAAARATRLRERVAQTARALQMSAADAVWLLEQHATIARPPSRMDYPAEIKRWKAFAYQAGQLAKRWERPP